MKYCFLRLMAGTLIIFLFLFSFKSYSQDKLSPATYLASAIPDSLKDNANAVVRYSSDELAVKALGKLVETHHSVVTVLNEKGDREAFLSLFYDKNFNSIGSVEMRVYNAAGTLVKKYHKSDMYDRSAADGYSIITDYRVMVLDHTISSYPATVEITYETKRNSYLDLGEWHYQKPETAVQYAEYKVSVNPSDGFRYMNKHTGIKPTKTTIDGVDHYTWSVSNLKAIKMEEYALDWQVLPKICFATKEFEYGGMPGDISNWQVYGKWFQALNADVCTLSPQRVEEIKAMTANLKTNKEKAKFLYEYMQQNMRYVSISLGIGGLKPFPATFVDQKKYGDCKALSNYMAALLKAVNIPSYYALVRAGENEEAAEYAFTAQTFNHAILCIPFKNDTTWLECTNTKTMFGKLGTFTENRNALLITENGGVLINTPKSKAQDNTFDSEVHLILDAGGGAKAKVKILSTGEYRSDYIGVAALKTDEQKQYLQRMLNIKQPLYFEFSPSEDKDGVKEINIELDYDKFCEMAAGNKMFYRPRAFDMWQLTLPALEKRKSDFYFDHPMQKTCVTTIDLPAGFEVETLPANQNLKCSYGNYEVKYVYDAAKNQVINTTRFNLTEYAFPAAKYTEMQQYFDSVAKAQNKKLVIRRKA